jgi:hypothetical protein
MQNIPEEAGLIVVRYTKEINIVRVVKKAKIRKGAIKLPDEEYQKLIELGCMRLHKMTKKIIDANQYSKEEKNETM